ncbi:20486_t:CDS:2, partial [Racocetra persica]
SENSYRFFYLDVSKSFNLIDTSSMHWTDLSFVPSIFRTYGASVVNDYSIYFFSGGIGSNSVDKFDALTEKWVALNFSGINTTLARTSVSYVQGVISNNKIYYFNPFNESTQHDLILVIGGYSQGRITSLNIKTFNWANLTNLNDGFRTGLYYHTATLIDHYIIIAFGYDANYYPNIYLNTYSNNISLLDISQKDNYKWATSYVAQGGGSPTPTPTPRYITTPSEIFGVVGGIIGIISGLVGLILVSCICYTYRRKNLHVNYSTEQIADHYPVSVIS